MALPRGVGRSDNGRGFDLPQCSSEMTRYLAHFGRMGCMAQSGRVGGAIAASKLAPSGVVRLRARSRIPEWIRAAGDRDGPGAHPELSPRELACRITDREGEFLSESSVYRVLKGRRPDREPRLHPAAGGRPFPTPDAWAQRAVADGLHVSAGGGLGLVLPLDRARRLLTQDRGLEAERHDAGGGRDRDAGPRARSHGGGSGPRRPGPASRGYQAGRTRLVAIAG